MTDTDDKDRGLTAEDARLAKAVVSQIDTPIDHDVAARLRAARQEAVYLADRKSRQRVNWLMPAGGAVAAGLVAAVMLREPAMQPMPALDEIEMAAAAELELLEELELLAWLEEDAGDAG